MRHCGLLIYCSIAHPLQGPWIEPRRDGRAFLRQCPEVLIHRLALRVRQDTAKGGHRLPALADRSENLGPGLLPDRHRQVRRFDPRESGRGTIPRPRLSVTRATVLDVDPLSVLRISAASTPGNNQEERKQGAPGRAPAHPVTVAPHWLTPLQREQPGSDGRALRPGYSGSHPLPMTWARQREPSREASPEPGETDRA